MLTNDNNRSGLLSAGGILSIMAGIFEINAGVRVLLTGDIMPYPLWLFPFLPGFWWEALQHGWLVVMGGLLFALGILAVIGGTSAIRRKRFGLSLAGAICTLLSSGLLGILAIIFVALGKREFGAERKENVI
jgi:hypothetical protein